MGSMPKFVIQEHYARTHHFDFRLEKDGEFRGWALPKRSIGNLAMMLLRRNESKDDTAKLPAT